MDQLADLARKIEPRVGLDDLTLTESQAPVLKAILERARDSHVERRSGIVVLFTGVGETGKASAAAGRENLRRIFDAAESVDVILFFDEADALFGKRGDVKDSHDRYASIEVNYLLQRLETYNGLAILSTKGEPRPDKLRRFHFVVDFPAPLCT